MAKINSTKKCLTCGTPVFTKWTRFCPECVKIARKEQGERKRMKNKKLVENKYCVDCGLKLFHISATRCRPCSRKHNKLLSDQKILGNGRFGYWQAGSPPPSGYAISGPGNWR